MNSRDDRAGPRPHSAFLKTCRIRDYGQLRKNCCAVKGQSRARAIHEIAGIEPIAKVVVRGVFSPTLTIRGKIEVKPKALGLRG